MSLLEAFGNETDLDQCIHMKPERERFILVAVFGTTVSLMSIIENSTLFAVWVTKASRRNSHFLYLICLAFFDTFISVSYLLLMSLSVFMDWFEISTLVDVWWSCMVPVLVMSHVTMTSSSFLITAATFERFLITVKSSWLKRVQSTRQFIVLLAILLAFIFKGTILLEISVYDRNCSGMLRYQAGAHPFFFNNSFYNTVYRFWVRNTMTVFAPFILCLYFNTRIVFTLRKQQRAAKLFRIANTEHKANVRAATRMLALVVCTYLAANMLNVFITAWEFIDMESLKIGHTEFYIYSADLVSFLTASASSLRLPIYCACNSEIRAEMYTILVRCLALSPDKKSHDVEMVEERTKLINETPRPDKRRPEFDRLAMALAVNFINSGNHENKKEEENEK